MDRRTSVPADTGVCLKPQHYADVVRGGHGLSWFEVHTENYLGAGGPPHHYLEAVRRDSALSFHGVGASLGSADGLDGDHLDRIEALVRRYQPGLVSEHLSWSAIDGVYLNDLLALPYTEEALAVTARAVDALQTRLGRRVLIENPSSYLRYAHSPIPEPEFLAALAARTGCGVLLDVNNVFVSARNLDFDPYAYLDAIPAAAVGEIHLAGHHVADVDGRELRIDDHGSRVCPEVWDLFAHALARTGAVPALIEWDSDVPAFDVLLEEARSAETVRAGVGGARADAA